VVAFPRAIVWSADASVIGACVFFPHAFISGWRYFAAVLSAYLVVMVAVMQSAGPTPQSGTPTSH
jgi:hypothetical protein